MDDASPRPAPEPDEHGWYALPDGKRTSVLCDNPACRAPYVPRRQGQRVCGRKSCAVWRHAQTERACREDPERWEKRKAQYRAGAKKYAPKRRARREIARAQPVAPPGAPTTPALRGRWFLTRHAQDAYRARYAPDATDAEVIDHLVALSEAAHFVRRQRDGQEVWRGPAPLSIRCVVGTGEGDLPALTTVLSPYRGARPNDPQIDPWTARAPDLGTHLPGAWRELRFAPAPHTPIPLAHASPLHGIVQTALGRDHDRTRADFCLTPARTVSGWGVYFIDHADALRVSAAPRRMHLYQRPMDVDFGPLVVRPKTPTGILPGRYAVRLTTLTPVCIRRTVDGATLVRVTPTTPSLAGSLTCREFLLRLGLDGETAPPWLRHVHLDLDHHTTRRASVEVAGHWRSGDDTGHVHGWEGDVWLLVNAPGLALLRCAEVVGLGGRVALGFGRVRVTVEAFEPVGGAP